MPGQANQWRRRYQAGELLHPFPSQGRVNMSAVVRRTRLGHGLKHFPCSISLLS
jgi:hypothetical protein